MQVKSVLTLLMGRLCLQLRALALARLLSQRWATTECCLTILCLRVTQLPHKMQTSAREGESHVHVVMLDNTHRVFCIPHLHIWPCHPFSHETIARDMHLPALSLQVISSVLLYYSVQVGWPSWSQSQNLWATPLPSVSK